MKSISTSTKVFWLLVFVLAALSALSVFLPQGNVAGGVPVQAMPASKPVMAVVIAGMMLVFYGGLGWLGLLLWRKLGYPDIWDTQVNQRQRFLIPALIGAGCGLGLVLIDLVFSRWSPIGRFAHPPFPTSLVASATAGIGEEIIFRLFYVSFWVWLLSRVLLRGKGQNAVFVLMAIFSAVAFAGSHLPTVMFLYGWQTMTQVPPVVLVELILMNSLIAIFAAFLMRKYGFLAAVGIHFWADVVWHVLYGMF
jgi:hypothetical protein